jgi:hypothetical protein
MKCEKQLFLYYWARHSFRIYFIIEITWEYNLIDIFHLLCIISLPVVLLILCMNPAEHRVRCLVGSEPGPALQKAGTFTNKHGHTIVLLRTYCLRYVAPTLQGKSHLCIPFLGIARPQSQFPHSCAVCDLYIPRICPHISLQQNRQTDPGNRYKSLTDICMSVGSWRQNSTILFWK